jgi:hypothetical protein
MEIEGNGVIGAVRDWRNFTSSLAVVGGVESVEVLKIFLIVNNQHFGMKIESEDKQLPGKKRFTFKK